MPVDRIVLIKRDKAVQCVEDFTFKKTIQVSVPRDHVLNLHVWALDELVIAEK